MTESGERSEEEKTGVDAAAGEPEAPTVAPQEDSEAPVEPTTKPRTRRRKPKAETAAAEEPVAEAEPPAEEPAVAEAEAEAEAAADADADADAEADADADADAEAEPEAEPAEKKPRRPRARKAEPEAPAPAPAPAAVRDRSEHGALVVRAHAKYVRSSARKARLVCDLIRGKSVEDARAILATTTRGVAEPWSKLLESAVANAENNHELDGDDLRILSIHADEGPTLKRYRPRAMGRATRIRKRTSHLSIQLTPKER